MTTTHAYFDLFKAIEEIHSPEIAAAAAQSTAWKMDAMIINAARALFRQCAETEFMAGAYDSLADTKNMFNEKAFAEVCFGEIGSDNTGPVVVIKELFYARDAWIALAERLTALTVDYKGLPRTYKAKELTDQIRQPNAMKVTVETKRKLKINAQRFAQAYEMPEMADQLFEQKVARSVAQGENISELMRTQAQGVIHILDLAIAHPMELPQGAVDANFYSLTADTQYALIDNAIRAIERAADQAAGDRNVKESDYDLMCLSAIKAAKQLKAVLKNPRFTQRAAEQQAAETQLG